MALSYKREYLRQQGYVDLYDSQGDAGDQGKAMLLESKDIRR
jgi:hypothetical protein